MLEARHRIAKAPGSNYCRCERPSRRLALSGPTSFLSPQRPVARFPLCRTAVSRTAPRSVTPGDFYLRSTSSRINVSRADLRGRESGDARTGLRRPEKSPFV